MIKTKLLSRVAETEPLLEEPVAVVAPEPVKKPVVAKKKPVQLKVDDNDWTMTALFGALAVVIAVAAFAIYRRRKSESDPEAEEAEASDSSDSSTGGYW